MTSLKAAASKRFCRSTDLALSALRSRRLALEILTRQSSGLEGALLETAWVSKPGVKDKVAECTSDTLASSRNAQRARFRLPKFNRHRYPRRSGEPLNKGEGRPGRT